MRTNLYTIHFGAIHCGLTRQVTDIELAKMCCAKTYNKIVAAVKEGKRIRIRMTAKGRILTTTWILQ